MKRVVFIILWTIAFGVLGFAAYMGVFVGMALAHVNMSAWNPSTVSRFGKFLSLFVSAIPLLGIFLGFYGKLPGTRSSAARLPPEAPDKFQKKTEGSWAGLFSIAWMLSIFFLIHYIIKPGQVTSWGFRLLIFALVCAQLSFGILLAHFGLKSGTRLGRYLGVLAYVLVFWFALTGLLPFAARAVRRVEVNYIAKNHNEN